MPVHPADAVREFHTFFKQPVRDEPTILEDKELGLRLSLLGEEYEELMEELESHDPSIERIYKEMADLAYVLYGLDQHMGNKLAAVFEEVHESNMSKLWDCETCGGTTGVADGKCPECDGKGLVPRYRDDGKVLKPPTYVKPDLSRVLNASPSV